uniref:hypothetical protein n=1 Tax=Salmonella sp. S146_54837 TaxID=2665635 RepID=UPI0016598336
DQDMKTMREAVDRSSRVQCFVSILMSKLGNAFQHFLDALEDSAIYNELNIQLKEREELIQDSSREEQSSNANKPMTHIQAEALNSLMDEMQKNFEPLMVMKYLIQHDVMNDQDMKTMREAVNQSSRVQCFVSILLSKLGNA